MTALGNHYGPAAAEVNVNAVVGQPKVAYKETITRRAKAEGRFVKQSGGHGQYGHVVLELGPLATGEVYMFVDKTTGGPIPRNTCRPSMPASRRPCRMDL